MSVCALLFAVLISTPPADEHPTSKPDEKPKPVVEETVLVTATRSERAVSELPVSATVVTEEEIRETPARSVDDVVRTIPGVHLSLVSGSGSTPNNQRISMRGLGGTRALVLLDGIPLHDPYSGIVQWQKVPLDSIRQVEVVRGGNASLFGNFALGGTINLITRPVDASAVTLDASYGSGDTGHEALTIDHTLTSKLAVRISHDRNDSNGFIRVPDAGPVDVNAWIESAITSARADYHASDRTSAFVNASTSQIDISQGTPVTYSKRDITAASAGIHRGIGAGALLSGSAFYQRQSERLVNSTLVGTRQSEFLSQDGTIPSTAKGASAEWSLQRRGAIPFISVGVDLQQLEAEEDRVTYNRNGAVTQRNRVGGRQRFAGIFAQASWHPADRLEILGSARLDTFHNENGSDVIEGGTSTFYPNTSSNQIDPRVSARYALGSHSAVRASAYRAFNAPTLRDLYRKNQTGNSVILGNPYLVPETLLGGEVGWEWANGPTHVEVNLYRNVIDGLQSRTGVPGQPANVSQYYNLGKGRSQGVEILADVRLSRRWSMDAGYTYADAVVIEDPNPDLVGKWLPEVPPHYGSLSVRFRGDHGTTADLRARVLSRSYGEAQNIALAPAHRVVDFSLSQQLRSWIDAYAMIENAFDETYYLALAPNSFRSGLPRTVTAGVRVNLRGIR
jgi:outer membrane receptor protein involved in Fe transport